MSGVFSVRAAVPNGPEWVAIEMGGDGCVANTTFWPSHTVEIGGVFSVRAAVPSGPEWVAVEMGGDGCVDTTEAPAGERLHGYRPATKLASLSHRTAYYHGSVLFLRGRSHQRKRSAAELTPKIVTDARIEI
ncbi:hypothetical protein QAD02_016254 [Eretmocerus hayati]|uniref:Uncharacterized protein n=1 Tax=Eretmocerus hayati TaxID=131215 RepID=A0ACC2PAX8_9HYME|nr:hypothetical protein QAD02_016254 [Eretmocerus hayati]